MHKLKCLEDTLAKAVQSQVNNLDRVDTKELGEVIDMIKDLEQAIYYCSISKAMEEDGNRRYYTEKMSMMDDDYDTYYKEMDKYYERDEREGKSPLTRKKYMEAKEAHIAKDMQMKELEKYIQDLGSDTTEMIKDMTPEEKQMLQQKIATLATKIK